MIPRDEEFFEDLDFGQHVSVMAAAYTVYRELSPNNKKPLTQREFYQEFIDNWNAFAQLEQDKRNEDYAD